MLRTSIAHTESNTGVKVHWPSPSSCSLDPKLIVRSDTCRRETLPCLARRPRVFNRSCDHASLVYFTMQSLNLEQTVVHYCVFVKVTHFSLSRMAALEIRIHARMTHRGISEYITQVAYFGILSRPSVTLLFVRRSRAIYH